MAEAATAAARAAPPRDAKAERTDAKAERTGAKAERSDALLQRLEWTVLRRLDGVLQGDHRTLMRGAGVDLADLREYQLHDDVRHIDWNVTARLQQPYVRQFLEDRDLSAWFLLDLSGSVDYGSGETTKRAVSTGFVAALARVITRHGNRVGAVMYRRRVDEVLPPGASRLHLLNLIERMRRPAAPLSKAEKAEQAERNARAAKPRKGTPPPGPGTALAELLDFAAGIVRRRSLLFVVSDFVSAPGWPEALGRLARRHEVIAVRLYDPAEQQLPDYGLVTVEDAETGEQLFVDAGDAAFRERYERFAAEAESRIREDIARAGVDTLELSTDDDLLDALLRFADLRRQRARQKATPRGPAWLRERSQAPAAEAATPVSSTPAAKPARTKEAAA